MKLRNYILAGLALLLTLPAVAAVSTIAPSALQCEYDASPVLDIQNPRLSWVNLNPAKVQGRSSLTPQI